MISQKKFSPYPVELLPASFKYPESYLRLSRKTDMISYEKEYGFPWWFEDYGTEGAELSFKLRNNKIPNMDLIPFAQNGDWKAYFNGSDTSGDPKVIVIDLTCLESYNIYNNFEEWLNLAVKDTW